MERSRGSTLIYSGAMIGTVFTLPVAGQLGKTSFLGGWPATYYLLGGVGIVWFVLWALLISESPESHPHISQKEHDYILQNGGGSANKDVSDSHRETHHADCHCSPNRHSWCPTRRSSPRCPCGP